MIALRRRRPWYIVLMCALAFGTLLASSWSLFIGLILALTAPNGFPGVLLMVGAIVFGSAAMWFLYEHMGGNDDG